MPTQMEVLSSQFGRWSHIDWFFKTVMETGYPYFEWEGRIYKVDYQRRKYTETEASPEDLK